jgi:hypothetical protein
MLETIKDAISDYRWQRHLRNLHKRMNSWKKSFREKAQEEGHMVRVDNIETARFMVSVIMTDYDLKMVKLLVQQQGETATGEWLADAFGCDDAVFLRHRQSSR